MLKHSIPKN